MMDLLQNDKVKHILSILAFVDGILIANIGGAVPVSWAPWLGLVQSAFVALGIQSSGTSKPKPTPEEPPVQQRKGP